MNGSEQLDGIDLSLSADSVTYVVNPNTLEKVELTPKEQQAKAAYLREYRRQLAELRSHAQYEEMEIEPYRAPLGRLCSKYEDNGKSYKPTYPDRYLAYLEGRAKS